MSLHIDVQHSTRLKITLLWAHSVPLEKQLWHMPNEAWPNKMPKI